MYKLLLSVTSVALLFLVTPTRAQAPVLGTSSTFALFSTNGAVSNTGLSHLTGNVGTNNGSNTNFGNVDGVMHDTNATTASAATSLTIACIQINSTVPDYFPAPLLGNGLLCYPGTYFIGQSSTLNNTLTLDAQGDPNAVFIFQIQGAFSSSAGAQVVLINGAQACNVFWKIEGLINLATNTVMKGTLIANNAAIVLNSGVLLEGRALSTTGAITVSGATVRIPLGCGTPPLTGPPPPPLNTITCYTVFSGNGHVSNTGISMITGEVGTNMGLTTGFQTEHVNGTIHHNPDWSTAECAADLHTVYNYLHTLPANIELRFPAALGQGLVLTPHTYVLHAATVLNGTLYLNAQGNPNAVFVIKINGAFTTATNASVVLQNGTQAKNVFWKIEGAITLNNYTSLKGTVIGNSGPIIVNEGVALEGRVLNRTGGITTAGINAHRTPGCESLAIPSHAVVKTAQFYPNPFTASLQVTLTGFESGTTALRIYNALGVLVFKTTLTQSTSELPMNLPTGIYQYSLSDAEGAVQNGKLISKQ